MSKIALLTNIPAPYREKVHELLYEKLNGNYRVFYCAEREFNRDWKFLSGRYEKILLSATSNSSVHNNPSVFKALNEYNPSVVIIMGFYPTMLYGWMWTLIKNKKLIVFTDGTLISESQLSFVHRLIRKLVFEKAGAFIGPALGSVDLYMSYGIKRESIFRTFLGVDNKSFYTTESSKKKYDVMFSGQFIDRKLPFFFIEVVKKVRNKIGKCSVLLLGNGPLKDDILSELKRLDIDFHFPGFVQQEYLPDYFSTAKIFLFPTKQDPWGIVANEAMAAGLPVLVSECAGVANDLVIQNETGYVLKNELNDWVEKVIYLLTNVAEYNRISANAKQAVEKYSYENAASGILDAIHYVAP